MFGQHTINSRFDWMRRKYYKPQYSIGKTPKKMFELWKDGGSSEKIC